jgi:hypothetical protein
VFRNGAAIVFNYDVDTELRNQLQATKLDWATG